MIFLFALMDFESYAKMVTIIVYYSWYKYPDNFAYFDFNCFDTLQLILDVVY